MFGTCTAYLFISCLLMRYLESSSFQQKIGASKRRFMGSALNHTKYQLTQKQAKENDKLTLFKTEK